MTKGNPRQQWLKALIASTSEGSLTAFSEKVRMDYTGLNLMVNGRRQISEKTVIKIANRLKVDPPEGVLPILAKAKAAPLQVDTITVDAGVFADLVAQVKLQTRLLNAVLDRLEGIEKGKKP